MRYKQNPARGIYREDNNQRTIAEIKSQTSSNFIRKLGLKALLGFIVIAGLSAALFGVSILLTKIFPSINDIYSTAALLILSILMGLILYSIYEAFIAPIALSRKCKEAGIAKCVGYEDRIFSGVRSSGVVKTAAIYEHNYGDKVYTVYNDKYIKNEERLPSIDQIVPIRFDSKNPNKCVINNEHPIMWRNILLLVLCLIMLFPFVITPKAGSNKMIIDNQTLSEEFPDTDYIVYERTITTVIGNTYYFSPAGGIQNFTTTDALGGCEKGDKIYWVQSSDGYSIVYPKSRYEYQGNKTYENCAKVTSDGKFLLTPEYLKDQLQAKSITVYDASIIKTGVNSIDLVLSDNRTLHLEYNNFDASAMGLSIGDKVYYVSWDYQGVIYSQRYNEYIGPLG
mgnify:CR=1 FL=1